VALQLDDVERRFWLAREHLWTMLEATPAVTPRKGPSRPKGSGKKVVVSKAKWSRKGNWRRKAAAGTRREPDDDLLVGWN
jgi:hypothetical protein